MSLISPDIEHHAGAALGAKEEPSLRTVACKQFAEHETKTRVQA